MALGNDRGAKPGAKIFWQFVEFRVAINLDGLLGRVANHIAVVAPRQMIFQFSLRARINRTVKVVSQLTQEIRALHCLVSPVSGFSLSGISVSLWSFSSSSFSLPFSRR